VRNPRDFGKPLAIGAPDPILEIPIVPSRMIHFLDFSNEKMVAKVPDIAPTVDILLGNLETSEPRSCGRGSTRWSRRGCSMTSRRSSPRSATASMS
jgi:hypothetical protein